MTKIKAAQPDFIYIPGYYQEVGLIVKQAREMGINVPMAGGDGWDSAKLLKLPAKLLWKTPSSPACILRTIPLI